MKAVTHCQFGRIHRKLIASPMSNDCRLVVILSPERSGSTLLSSIVGAHS